MLYLGAVIGGIGGGAVYATSVGQAVKWFPDRRGLAVGLTAAGYGAGAALTVVPIRAVIDTAGYEAAFFWFGLVQGGIVFLPGFCGHLSPVRWSALPRQKYRRRRVATRPRKHCSLRCSGSFTSCLSWCRPAD